MNTATSSCLSGGKNAKVNVEVKQALIVLLSVKDNESANRAVCRERDIQFISRIAPGQPLPNAGNPIARGEGLNASTSLAPLASLANPTVHRSPSHVIDIASSWNAWTPAAAVADGVAVCAPGKDWGIRCGERGLPEVVSSQSSFLNTLVKLRRVELRATPSLGKRCLKTAQVF